MGKGMESFERSVRTGAFILALTNSAFGQIEMVENGLRGQVAGSPKSVGETVPNPGGS